MTTMRLALALLLITMLGCGERRETAETASPATTTGAAPGATAAATPPPGAVVGNEMPAYSAPLLDGTNFDMASERGNVVLLNLWATWCGPCRYEIPELQKLHNAHSAQGLKVVGVSVDEGGDQVVRDFVREQNMTYPIALDPEGRLATLFDTTILPTSAIVDRNGRIVWKHFGVVTTTDAEMMRALEQALKGSVSAAALTTAR